MRRPSVGLRNRPLAVGGGIAERAHTGQHIPAAPSSAAGDVTTSTRAAAGLERLEDTAKVANP